MHRFKELEIWKKGVSLTTNIYKATASFPKEEMYGLTSQIRRAAVSIPSNIAEGAGRNSDAEFVRFLSISSGSCCELETQLIIAVNLDFLNEAIANDFYSELASLQRMNFKLQKKFGAKVLIPNT